MIVLLCSFKAGCWSILVSHCIKIILHAGCWHWSLDDGFSSPVSKCIQFLEVRFLRVWGHRNTSNYVFYLVGAFMVHFPPDFTSVPSWLLKSSWWVLWHGRLTPRSWTMSCSWSKCPFIAALFHGPTECRAMATHDRWQWLGHRRGQIQRLKNHKQWTFVWLCLCRHFTENCPCCISRHLDVFARLCCCLQAANSEFLCDCTLAFCKPALLPSTRGRLACFSFWVSFSCYSNLPSIPLKGFRTETRSCPNKCAASSARILATFTATITLCFLTRYCVSPQP